MSLNLDFFSSFPLLSTNRLDLRDIRPEDAPQIFEMRSSGRVGKFIARSEMQTLELAHQLVERTNNAYRNGLAIGWAGVIKNSTEIIGTCGFNQFDFPNLRAEIGGEMAVEYWGRKLALEAVEAIIAFGLEQIGLHSIEAKVAPDNRSAVFLLEQLGFEKEAHFKNRIFFNGHFLDMAIYTLHRK